MIPWLTPSDPFPPPASALTYPNGLLAAGHKLNCEQLINAYRQGIFPWSTAGEPVLWWSPDPRMVLFREEFQVSHSLRKTIRAVGRDPATQIRCDSAFDAVMRACAQPRPGQDGTWITPEIWLAYGELHRRGLAHSIEVWRAGTLAAGLYGVSLGRMFFGESMFTLARDLSKIALATLVQIMRNEHVVLIDCQQSTAHLASLGAREITRADFCAHLNATIPQTPIDWQRYRSGPLNTLLASS